MNLRSTKSEPRFSVSLAPAEIQKSLGRRSMREGSEKIRFTGFRILLHAQRKREYDLLRIAKYIVDHFIALLRADFDIELPGELLSGQLDAPQANRELLLCGSQSEAGHSC